MFVEDASYLSFREISLSYAIPNTLAEKLYLQGLSLAVTGQNLGYLTKAKTIPNPETGGGYAGSGYALPRTVLFSLNVTF